MDVETVTDNTSGVTHHRYCPPEVDAAVQHTQAFKTLVDMRSKGERSVVHAHTHARRGCSLECKIYHECKTDGKPRGHSVGEMCPEPEDEDAAEED